MDRSALGSRNRRVVHAAVECQVERGLPYLNIWTPAKDASGRLPAMIWIHVGVFVAGSGSNMGAGGGEEMARKRRRGGYYRLGVFGF